MSECRHFLHLRLNKVCLGIDIRRLCELANVYKTSCVSFSNILIEITHNDISQRLYLSFNN